MANAKFNLNSDLAASVSGENVVQRLRRRIQDAQRLGFRVRTEWLDDQQASWCEIGGVKTLFVNLSQTAAEQLQQLEESLAAFVNQRNASLARDAQASEEAAHRAA